MNVRSSSLVVACAVLLSASSPGLAQPVGDKKKALALWEKAKVQYDLGRWPQAIDLWVQAYETFNAPEFLFNIGQAYRQDGNCARALFFYRRYLATKPDARNRAEVEGLIKDLDASCKPSAGPSPGRTQAGKPAQPGGGATGTGRITGKPAGSGGRASVKTGKPAGSGDGASVKTGKSAGPTAGPTGRGPDVADAGGVADDEGDDGGGDDGGSGEGDVAGGVGVDASGERPALFALRVAGGPSFPSFGNLEVGTLASFDLGVGHPLYMGSFVLEPGVLVGYTPVPWEEGEESGTAGMISLLANVGLSREVASGLSVRGELGLGALIFSGLTVEGNPFLDQGYGASGAIPFFDARVALGAEYALNKSFILHAQPLVFSYSPSPQLKDGIDAVTRFEILVGAGYRM